MAEKIGISISLDLIDKLSTPAKKMRDAFANTNKKVLELQRTLGDTRASEKNIAAFKATQAHAAKNIAVIEKLNSRFKKRGKLTDAQSARLKKSIELGKQYNLTLGKQAATLKRASINTKNLQSAEDSLSAKRERTISQLGKINRKMKRSAELSKKLASIRKKMGIGGAAAAYGGLAAARRIGNIFQGAVEFDTVMSEVQAVARLSKGSKEYKDLRQQSKDLGRTTTFTNVQAAGGQAFLARAGWEAAEILAAMPSVLDLAKGTKTGVEETADFLSNIMGAFKLEAKDAQMVADVLAGTTTRSNVSLTQLADTMRYVGPVAAKLGDNIQDVAAVSGLLGNVGIQGSMAGTGVRALYQRLAAQPAEVKKVLKDLNIETADKDGNQRGMVSLLKEIAQKTSGMGTQKAGEVFSKLSGLRAMAALAELSTMAKNGVLDKFVETLYKTQGETKKLRIVMENNVGGDIERNRSAFSGLTTSILESDNAGLRATLQLIAEITNGITDWTEKNPELTATIATVAAGVLALAVVVGTLAVALSIMSVVIGAISLPLAGVVLGLASIAAQGYLIYKFFGGFKEFFSALFEVIVKISPVAGVMNALADAGIAIYKNWGGISDFFGGIWASIKSVFYSGMVGVLHAVKAITSIIPDSFLPKSMEAAELDASINKFRELRDLADSVNATSQAEPFKVITTDWELTKSQKNSVDVNIKIDSQLPAEIESVKSTGNPIVDLEVGDLAPAF